MRPGYIGQCLHCRSHIFVCNAKGWNKDDLGLARIDTILSMGFATVVFTGCALSMLGPFIKGSFFLLLPLMLALGLTGTPLIVGIIIYLLNKPEIVGKDYNNPVLNMLGGLTFMVTALLAIRFVLTHIGKL